MISMAVTKEGKQRGYLVADYYIPNYLVKYFTNKPIKCAKQIVQSSKDGVILNNKQYKSIAKILGKNSYRNIIRDLIINGMDLSDILFIPIEPSDMIMSDCSSVWSQYLIKVPKGYCLYMVVSSNCKEYGYLLVNSDLFKENNELKIVMFETTVKQKGYGSKVISCLLNNVHKVSGLSLEQSKGFWLKMGATIIDNEGHFEIIRKGDL